MFLEVPVVSTIVTENLIWVGSKYFLLDSELMWLFVVTWVELSTLVVELSMIWIWGLLSSCFMYLSYINGDRTPTKTGMATAVITKCPSLL